jgi:crossover junction endodeoxyribonuclease RuvC
MRVLGIDPGSNFLGLGCVEARGNALLWIGHAVVKVSEGRDESLEAKLRAIHRGVSEALDLWQPEAVAVEEVFFAKNPKSALKLGQARGAALLVPALRGLTLFEYSATLVKQTVTGSGRAEKEQVQRMVKALLGGAGKFPMEFERSDASDALAIAICHVQHRHRHSLLQRQRGEKDLVRPPFAGKTEA